MGKQLLECFPTHVLLLHCTPALTRLCAEYALEPEFKPVSQDSIDHTPCLHADSALPWHTLQA